MKKIHFQILGITIFSEKYCFHDGGYVDSIPEEIIRLNRLYEINPEYNGDEDKNVIGKHYAYCSDSHIFYLKHFTNLKNIHIRAHEETHALEYVGGLGYLAEALYKNQRVKINFNEVDKKEVRAELGAIYALHSRGMSPWRLLSSSLLENNFIKARELYNQSKLSKKRIFIFK